MLSEYDNAAPVNPCYFCVLCWRRHRNDHHAEEVAREEAREAEKDATKQGEMSHG